MHIKLKGKVYAICLSYGVRCIHHSSDKCRPLSMITLENVDRFSFTVKFKNKLQRLPPHVISFTTASCNKKLSWCWQTQATPCYIY